VTAAATVAATLAAGFVAVRLLAPIVAASPSYPDFDGPKLARLAERTWRPIGGDIPYIVSFGDQRGRQAAGSILFDSSARSHVFENADHRLSPWIDVADLALRGALVVSTRPLLPNEQVAGRPIEQIAEFERPTVRARFRKPPVIYFGVVPPVSEN
jgi:hypothetical protein